MGNDESKLMVDESTPPTVLSARTPAAVAEYILEGKAKRIVVITGAGISTSAGIPDFRSPKTGLYANLARLNLPYAEAVFDISYFRSHPEPFYMLARELYPGRFHPTISHVFIALLARKGLLHRLFTQNIDCLERVAGVPPDLIVEAHGSFATQSCIECRTPFDDAEMRKVVEAGQVPRCPAPSPLSSLPSLPPSATDAADVTDANNTDNAKNPKSAQEAAVVEPASQCGGLVKPDIVFFGEPLPRLFAEKRHAVSEADLALIIGTSLSVFPFAALPELVRYGVPRTLFNLEKTGMIGNREDDVLALGPCDEGIRRLAQELGWEEELETTWQDMVGAKEAERQKARAEGAGTGAGGEDEELEEELARIVDSVDKGLRISADDTAADGASTFSNADQKTSD